MSWSSPWALFGITVAVASVGCTGVSVGDPGDGESPCSRGPGMRVVDFSRPLGHFEESGDAVIAPASGSGDGELVLLSLEGELRSAFTLRLAVDRDSVRFEPGIKDGDSSWSGVCPDVIVADVSIDLEAGPVLELHRTATLSAGHYGGRSLSFRSFEGVETNLTLEFEAVGERGAPDLGIHAGLEYDDGVWSGHFDLFPLTPCESVDSIGCMSGKMVDHGPEGAGGLNGDNAGELILDTWEMTTVETNTVDP